MAKPQAAFKKSMKGARETQRTLQSLDAVKMISLYVLRNQGYGKKRLEAFNDKWNEYLEDISEGRFSLMDIAWVLEDECGLNVLDLKIKPTTGSGK